MDNPLYRRTALRALIVLALTQTCGWGGVSLLPVLAGEIARDLAIGLPSVFAGTSVMYIAMALLAPFAGRGFARFGTTHMMAAGSLMIGAGLGFLALAQGIAAFLTAWAVIGVAGAAFLTTSAYVYLNDVDGAMAKNRIAILMLATGLATALFWPVTGVLAEPFGWRGTAAIYGGLMATLVPALVVFGLPAARFHAETPGHPARPPTRRVIFWLIVVTLSLTSFATTAASAIALPLNMINATAPPALAWILTQSGAAGVLGLSVMMMLAAYALILVLQHFRPVT